MKRIITALIGLLGATTNAVSVGEGMNIQINITGGDCDDAEDDMLQAGWSPDLPTIQEEDLKSGYIEEEEM